MLKSLLQSICLFTIVIFTIVTTTMPSLAHWADLAVGEIKISERSAVFDLTIPVGLVSFADDDRDNQLTALEIDRHTPELKSFLGDKIQLFDQQGALGTWSLKPAPQALAVPQANTQTHTTFQLDYAWGGPIESLTLRYKLFDPAAPAARCLITSMHHGKTQSLIFTPVASEFNLISRSIAKQIYSFVLLGVEHILTGYDHILFLISLLLVTSNFGQILKIVTAFTLAHSVTLTLAVLNIVTLPSQWVEAAIALTIIYVASENLWKKNFDHRWALTFGFGLIHGLGFSGALREIQIPQSNLFTSLASFNLGVEMGQMLVVTACFVLLKLLRKQLKPAQWQLNFQRVASVGIVIMGVIWLFERVQWQ
jgi:hydrogenase/urease accessory protein HupE